MAIFKQQDEQNSHELYGSIIYIYFLKFFLSFLQASMN